MCRISSVSGHTWHRCINIQNMWYGTALSKFLFTKNGQVNIFYLEGQVLEKSSMVTQSQ
uniref:Uncharacterized protein n=1 Tax=Anguilla anguilla TaxID=7936 RepID=A0A0E9XGI6_ANGAN